jgi:hypothetical protein
MEGKEHGCLQSRNASDTHRYSTEREGEGNRTYREGRRGRGEGTGGVEGEGREQKKVGEEERVIKRDKNDY